MPKTKLGATRAYVTDWMNALRLLWHVFVASPGSRRKARGRGIDAARPVFRDVTKLGEFYWYLPISLSPLFCL